MVGALAGCIVFLRVTGLIVIVLSFLSTLLFLLFYSFVDVLSLLLVFLRAFGIKGSFSLGGMLWFSIGVLCVAMVLVVPFLLSIPGKIGFLLICMVFMNGFLTQVLNGFLRQVVITRRDEGIRNWKVWVREDLSSRPYAWLRPDFVPPSPFLVARIPELRRVPREPVFDLPRDTPLFNLDETVFGHNVRSARRGAAGGPSGITCDH